MRTVVPPESELMGRWSPLWTEEREPFGTWQTAGPGDRVGRRATRCVRWETLHNAGALKRIPSEPSEIS